MYACLDDIFGSGPVQDEPTASKTTDGPRCHQLEAT